MNGMKDHQAHICRTPKHFVKLYQASIKRKGNNTKANLTIQNNGVKANFAYKDDQTDHAYIHNDVEANFGYKDDDLTDITHLNTVDYFEDHN